LVTNIAQCALYCDALFFIRLSVARHMIGDMATPDFFM